MPMTRVQATRAIRVPRHHVNLALLQAERSSRGTHRKRHDIVII
jgi:hypothetical protein